MYIYMCVCVCVCVCVYAYSLGGLGRLVLGPVLKTHSLLKSQHLYHERRSVSRDQQAGIIKLGSPNYRTCTRRELKRECPTSCICPAVGQLGILSSRPDRPRRPWLSAALGALGRHWRKRDPPYSQTSMEKRGACDEYLGMKNEMRTELVASRTQRSYLRRGKTT
jgi:hypothetical protein